MEHKSNKDKAIHIRITQADLDRLKDGAKNAGVSLSAFIRHSLTMPVNTLQTECEQHQ
jgi:predicted DNA binding CopG/RHH family protein